MKTATERYLEKRHEVEAKLSRLHFLLGQHELARRQRPSDWGFVGDLTHIEYLLDGANEFLARPSASGPEPAVVLTQGETS